MKLRSLVFGFSIILFSSCTKEDDITSIENENIELVYPVKTQDLNPCCIDFQWDNPEEGNSRILVSKNQNFTDLILDSSVAINSFSLKTVLQPNTEYFWKVSNSTTESQSSFKIKDVLGGLKPVYSNIKIRRYEWASFAGGITKDTTFYDSIKLTREGEKVRFEFAKDNINQLHKLDLSPSPLKNSLRYRTDIYTQGNGGDIIFNYLNDTIFINRKSGGLGGGVVWQIKFRK